MLKMNLDNASVSFKTDSIIKKGLSELLSFDKEGMEAIKKQMEKKYQAMGRDTSWLKKWDGRTKVMDGRKNKFPTGLLPTVLEWCKKEDLKYELTDKRIIPSKIHNFSISPKFKLRYYQEDVIPLSEKYERGIYEYGTGLGKSVMIANKVAHLKMDTLIIVPDLGLKKQLYNDFVDYGFDESMMGTSVECKKPVIICNIASLANKDSHWFRRFKVLIIEEFHHSAAESYLKVNGFLDNAYYRYGFTGTNVRPDGNDMIMAGVLSNVISKKTVSEAIDEGFLVPPTVNILKHRVKGYSRYNYRDTYDKIIKDEFLQKRTGEIITNKVMHEGKKCLVLVRRKGHGQDILKRIPFATYLHGDHSVEERERAKQEFKEGKSMCLIATSIFKEGQNLPAIDCLFNLRFQKGEIETKQGVGRALRLAEGTSTIEESIKAGKNKAEVFDFLILGNKYLTDHSVERINQYKSEPSFKIKVQNI